MPVTNPGGAGAGINTVVYFVETELTIMYVPANDAGTMSVIRYQLHFHGIYMNVDNAGYGPQQRVFTKQ
jgi:hypothetical protein